MMPILTGSWPWAANAMTPDASSNSSFLMLASPVRLLFLADVYHAALLVPFVHPDHHAVGIESRALALGKVVLHALRAHYARIAERLHGRADLLLVGRA